MCYNQLVIRNNVKTGHRNIRLTRTVPCGICEECISKYQNEWFLRAYYQYKDTVIDHHGCCAFITLTYNDYHLPYFEDDITVVKYKDGKPNGTQTKHVRMMCFNREHIKYFMRLVKRYCKTYLNYTSDDIAKIKYIICSEYGSDEKHTHRSHYHGLLFFPYELSVSTLNKILDFSWAVCDPRDKGKRFEHQRRYRLGFHSYSKQGAFVSDPRAIKYVLKYSTKDINGFMDWHGILDYIKESPAHFDKIKQYLPFHSQSQGFGLYGCDFITDEDLIRGFVNHPTSEKFENPDTLPLPEYYKQRLLFTKPQIKNNASIGMRSHSEKYYELLPNIVNRKLQSQRDKLCDILYSYSTFKAQYLNTGIEETRLQNLYNCILAYLDKRYEDYVLYKELTNYSTTDLQDNINAYTTLLQLIEKTAKEHDYIVNNYDLTEDKYKLETVVHYEKETEYIIQDVEAVYNYQGLPLDDFMQSYEDMCLALGENIGSYTVSFQRTTKPKLELVKHHITKQDGTPYLQANKHNYIIDHPRDVADISISRQWHDLPVFQGFEVVSDILDELNRIHKQNTSLGNKAEWLKNKYVRDCHNAKLIFTN